MISYENFFRVDSKTNASMASAGGNRDNSKYLLEESVIIDNKKCMLKLFGDCIEVINNSGDDNL